MRSALICGAGVAGPALALWLSRSGWRVTVVERAPRPREGGHAVDFRGRAQLGVLERMGVLEEVRRRQTGMGAVTLVDAAGRRRATLPAAVMSGDVEILRGDLARVLYDATRDSAEYVFGDSAISLTETPEGVRVAFERSAPRTFDLVAGADGIRSTVRELAFGPGGVHHLGVYGASFTAPNPLGLRDRGVMYSAPGLTAGMYAHGDRVTGTLDFASPPIPHDHRDTEAQRRLCEEAFAGAGWHVPALLRAMREAEDFYFHAAEQVRLDRYSRGRVVLLGDAAYGPGPGGMGTGLALIGAYVLAGELAAAGGDHRRAFARYEERIRPYAAVCHKQARGIDTYLVPKRRRQIWMREQTFRMMGLMPGKGLVRAMIARGADAIELPGYPLPETAVAGAA
ncbi:2-polyprenyl-6-methoxyphenol hydroxylase-like FAD-dependent oxidoreductase [Thermocatellispora tengchongensis]|uniref:2-polyprenyl-6-methoxyphenol hydroxylase-like FAD-dependent oxidoreductase n=1 Tax=Thermocatellispora tengchongensis TaxID=1073253 RepID=A0A840P6M3_9ACTN|nr:FAD-dependent monooxygenase [Thermocatellispora tengchongensis]MBB5133110.1 2-polyprenyl-6-methoxyphenol hydroxylase-like FAD-dependent oxidoreductase [Thermocatellispora tengchongensis]